MSESPSALRMYDIATDEFREATATDLADLIQLAALQSQFIVSKGLRDEWQAFRNTQPKE